MLPRTLRPLRAGRPVAVMLTLTGLVLAVGPPSLSSAQAAGSSCGGWISERVPGTSGGPNILHGVAATSARNAWAVSYFRAGSYWTSRIVHWNGRSWKPQPTPVPHGTELYGVAAVSASTAWVVGDYYDSGDGHYKTVILRWKGHSWSRQASPNPPGADGHLRGVAAASATSAWAVGSSYASPHVTTGRTLILHWNGHRWSRQASPDVTAGTNALSAVTATSPWNAWAVGQYDTSAAHPLIVRWNGHSWSRQRSPNPVGSDTLNAVTATSRSNAWAVGQDYGNETLVLRWNGRSWFRQVSPNARVPDDLNGVAATSASNMWAAGYYVDAGQNRSMVIHWYRGAWYTPSRATGVGNSALYGIAATPANVWAVGQIGGQNLALRHC